MPRLDLGPVEDLPVGERACVEHDGRRVVVFNTEEGIFAIDAVCAHTGGPLENGVLKDGVVTCPWHLHRYEIATGDRVDLNGVSQQSFQVTVEDGRVGVDVPESEPKTPLSEILLRHAKEWTREA